MALDPKTFAEMDALLGGNSSAQPEAGAVDVQAMDALLSQPSKYAEPTALSEGVGQLATGIVKGLPNLIDTGAAGVATLADKALGVSDKPIGQVFEQYAEQRPVSTGVDAALSQVSKVLGGSQIEERKPTIPIGRYANLAGQGLSTVPLFAPATASNLVRGGLGGFGSGVGGDVGQAVGGDVGQAVGSLGGAVLGGVSPEIANATMKKVGPLTLRAQAAFQSKIAPTLEPDVAKLAQRSQELGIPLSISQAAPSRVRDTMQKVSQVVPFSGVGKFEDAQASSWNKAFAKTLGLDADKVSPEMVKQFKSNIESGYDNALKGTTVRIKSDQIQRLDNIANEAKMSLSPELARVVQNNVNQVKNDMKSGFMRGERANSIRKSISNRASNAQSEMKDWLGQVAATVNDVIADSIPEANSNMLRTLNKQYRNFKTAEPLLEKASDGMIDPVRLMQRVASSKFIKASGTVTGEDELVDLARIGQMLPRLRGSDTFEKQLYGAAANIAGTGGAGAGLLANAPATATAIAANRAYQGLYNQSQKMLEKAIEKSLPKGVTRDTVQKVSDALATGDANAIVKAAGNPQTASQVLNVIKNGAGKDVQKEAFELSKTISRKPATKETK